MKRSCLCGLALLLAGLAAAAGMQPNCKKYVKNYVLEYCTGFLRDKRSPRSAERPGPAGDLESAIKESRIRKPRQAMTLSEIVMTSRVPVYHYQYPHVPHGFSGTVYVPVVPATDTDEYEYELKPKLEALPQEKNGDLGFDMDLNELEELFEELFDRLPRSPNQSPNELYDQFMKSAFACCNNNDMCKNIGSLVKESRLCG